MTSSDEGIGYCGLRHNEGGQAGMDSVRNVYIIVYNLGVSLPVTLYILYFL